MNYEPSIAETNPPAYVNHSSVAEPSTTPVTKARVGESFLSGPRLAPGLALLIALVVSLLLWAGVFGIIHFL